MFAPVRTAAPAALISLEEAKSHLRVDHDDEDALITAQIEAATAYFDGWSGVLGRALVTQTWVQPFSAFCDRLSLPLAPAQTIEEVAYSDSNGSNSLSPDVYELLVDALGPYVARRPNQSWPAVDDSARPVSVAFVAGYGDAADVPAPIKQAALLKLQVLYERVTGDDAAKIEQAISSLIAPYRRVGF